METRPMRGDGLLEGKVMVLSGVGKGLGRFIVENACAAGASVMMAARSSELGTELARELARDHPVAFHQCDITSEADCEALIAAAQERFGGVDCVVNNAASTARGITLEEASIDDWRPVFEVNFFGSLRLVKAAIPALKRSQGGSVVFVGSQIVRRVFAGRGPYASSKAALLTPA